MSVSKALLQTVKQRVQDNVPTGLKEIEVDIIPEGLPIPSQGQRFVSIYGTRIVTINPNDLVKKRRWDFGVAIIQRIRDTPNDRFGEILYEEEYNMILLAEQLMSIIESQETQDLFKTTLDAIPIEPYSMDPPYDPEAPPSGLPSKYNIHSIFYHEETALDPIHLYPSDFYTRQKNSRGEIKSAKNEIVSEKIAGYKVPINFVGPIISEQYPSFGCNKYNPNTGGSSS